MRVWVRREQAAPTHNNTTHPSGLRLIPSQPDGETQPPTHFHAHTHICTGTRGHASELIFTSKHIIRLILATHKLHCVQHRQNNTTHYQTALDCQWVHTAFISFNKPKQEHLCSVELKPAVFQLLEAGSYNSNSLCQYKQYLWTNLALLMPNDCNWNPYRFHHFKLSGVFIATGPLQIY